MIHAHIIKKPLQDSSEDSDSISSLENFNYPIKPSLETWSVVYFSGYLANKCFEKFKCEICRSSLITQQDLNDNNQLLILHKQYDHVDKNYGLKYPSKELVEISTICLEIFNSTFYRIQSDKLILKHLMNIAKKNINKKCSILKTQHAIFIIYIYLNFCFVQKFTKSANGKMQTLEIDRIKTQTNCGCYKTNKLIFYIYYYYIFLNLILYTYYTYISL